MPELEGIPEPAPVAPAEPAPVPEAPPVPAEPVEEPKPVYLRDLKPAQEPQSEPEEVISITPPEEPQPVIVQPDVDFDEDFDPDAEDFIPMVPMGSVREIPNPAEGDEEIAGPASEPDDDEPPFDLEDPPASASMVDRLTASIPKSPIVQDIDRSVQGASAPMDIEVVDTHQLSTERGDVRELQTERPGYEFPSLDFLKEDEGGSTDDATEELRLRSATLTDTLSSFGVEARIVGVIRGPSVTRYEMQLDRGVKLSRITNLQNDIALALGATGVRIAPIPDKSAVGIEVPNKVVQFVYLRDVLTSANMTKSKSKITFALGKDITGECVVADIGKMPHLLIAGTTGSGKSVCINSIIISLLYRAAPEEVRLIMIDPKMVELGNYNGIPHLLIPVVTDHKKAAGALNWAVIEMERRYKLMSEAGARDLATFNKIMEQHGEEKLPQIVIIIDELADLMMVAAKEVEESICRIAQKARAAGMHLIIATQRPSADVLTGLMKSNIPSRIAFAVSSQMESRIILDTGGADKLIGRGDMLFMPIGSGKPTRVQGCFLSGDEIEEVVDFIKSQGQAEYSQEILDHLERATAEEGGGSDVDDDDADPMLGDAIDVVMETGQASASMLQRRLKLGYARAARIIDQMEARGIVGGFDGSRPRQIQITKADWQEMKMRYGVRS
ncbi:MAG: DNA translocase FtsK [Ruminococcaceae bacterium]|nr:DNA translocase FtsK [Oscillospiraceae bacterium]